MKSLGFGNMNLGIFKAATAAVSSIPPVTVTGGGDCLLPDPLLQPGSCADIESNVILETTTLNKGVLDEGNVSDLIPVPAESTLEMQTTVPETSETPKSKKQERGSKTKKVTSFYFDSANPPQSVCWVQTDSSADTWTPYCNGYKVPGTRKQEWDAVFSSVSKLGEGMRK